jgi:hypothetical protein
MLLDRDALTTLCSTSIEHLATTLGGASLAETVSCSAALLTGLIRTFHSELPINRRAIVISLLDGVNLTPREVGALARSSRLAPNTESSKSIKTSSYED